MLNFSPGREARPASAAWNVAKTMFQVVVFWSLFLFIVPAVILAGIETPLGLDAYRLSSPDFRWAGVLLFVLGGVLGLTSSATMAVRGRGTPLPSDCPRALVIAGPYRYIRNPMAVAGLLQGIAVGIYLGSPLVIAYALLGGPVWHFVVRPWEEMDLERRFGAPYRAYRSAVPCWLPRCRCNRRAG